VEITACSTLHSDSFEESFILKEKKHEFLSLIRRTKKVPLAAKKKIRYVVFQNIKVSCEKFGNNRS
jgi:hypothetical protein